MAVGYTAPYYSELYNKWRRCRFVLTVTFIVRAFCFVRIANAAVYIYFDRVTFYKRSHFLANKMFLFYPTDIIIPNFDSFIKKKKNSVVVPYICIKV